MFAENNGVKIWFELHGHLSCSCRPGIKLLPHHLSTSDKKKGLTG